MKSTSKRTSTKSVNGVKVTTTVVEETTTHPDGRREKVITETIEQGGKTTTNVTKSTEQGPPQDQPSISSGAGQSFPTKAPQGNQTLDESNEDALKAHNELRAQHGVPPLTLAKDLIDYAQKWAEHMASTGSFNHSNCTLNGQRLGENIAYTGSSAPTDYAGKDYTQSWYSEIKDHNFSKDHQGGTGHFTQVVWKGTKEVGFGKAKSADGRKVYVCGSYRPPGNMLGDFKSNVFPLKK